MREEFKDYKLCTGITYRDFACVKTAQETQDVYLFLLNMDLAYYVNIFAVAGVVVII